MINQQTQALLDRFKNIPLLPKQIMQLIEAKEEDPFDIEGIVKPVIEIVTYEHLKTYLLKHIKRSIS